MSNNYTDTLTQTLDRRHHMLVEGLRSLPKAATHDPLRAGINACIDRLERAPNYLDERRARSAPWQELPLEDFDAATEAAMALEAHWAEEARWYEACHG